MSKNTLLEEVFELLVKVEVLKVVNDANVVDKAATLTEELVAGALEARLDKLLLFGGGADGDFASLV